jgi:cytochrome c biogenesis factor
MASSLLLSNATCTATVRSIFLAVLYVGLAVWLMQARRWHVGRPWFRAFVADYGATIAVVIVTLLSYAVKVGRCTLNLLNSFDP